MSFFYLMLLNKLVPGTFKRVPIVETFTLTPEPNKSIKEYRFSPGFFEIFSLAIQDDGKHIGADVIFSLIPLTKTGAINVSTDKASARMLYYEYYGNQIGPFRVDRFDEDNGIYTVTADFIGGKLPVLDPYKLEIRYPKITEVGDETAKDNYGYPVVCTLEGFCYTIDLDKAVEAVSELIARGFIKAMRGMKVLEEIRGV